MSNVSLVDVKHCDGEPWEVAGIAGAQTKSALELSQEALEGLWWAARGSWLSQEEYRTGRMPDGETFAQTPVGKRLVAAQETLAALVKSSEAVVASAAWNPKSY